MGHRRDEAHTPTGFSNFDITGRTAGLERNVFEGERFSRLSRRTNSGK